MRDAVADVLTQRARIGAGGARRGLAISLVAHGVLFALIAIGAREPLRPAAPKMVNIRFAPAPIQAPAQSRPAAAPAAAPVEKKAAPAVEVPKPAPPPPETKAPAAKKEAYAPKQESLFGRSDRKVAPPETKAPPADTKAPPAAAAPAPGTSGAGFATPEVGTAGVTGLEGGDFPYTIYVTQMVNKIGSNWLRPQTQGEPLAEVYFVIERDGSIREAKISTPSGVPTFDRAALRAVLSSSPLPPLPFGYSGTWLGVRLTFH